MTHMYATRTNQLYNLCAQGYATCWVEKDSLEMCLLKYFTRSKEKDWKNEIEILREIAKNGAHDNLIAFRWHSEGRSILISSLARWKSNKAMQLLCYFFISVCDVNIGFQTTKLPSIKNANL